MWSYNKLYHKCIYMYICIFIGVESGQIKKTNCKQFEAQKYNELL